MVHEDLGIDESREIIVRKKTGEEYRGYPDARESQHGLLAVLSSGNSTAASELKPMSIDDVASIQIVTN